MRTILKGGTIVHPVNGSMGVQSLTIEDGKIAAIGDTTPNGADQVVDVSGKWLLPGFFNCHAHLGWDGVHDLQAQAEEPGEIIAYKCFMNIQKSLKAGVTTVRDLGMNDSNIYAKRAIDAGIAPYLRLIIVGRALSITGGHTWWCCRQVDGPEDARKAVREQLRVGATWIKFMGSHEFPEFTPAEMEAIVDEAHMAEIKVTAHATFDEAIRRVVAAGVDCVEHGGSISEETIEMMLERGVWMVPTFSPLFLQAQRGLEYGMSQADVDRRKRQMAEPARFAGNQASAKAGIPMAFGTDAGSPVVPHDEIVVELQTYVKLGVCEDNLAALRCLTERSATLLGLDDKLGTLEEGKIADVVVVGADPVADLEALRLVERVYVKGELAYMAVDGCVEV